MPRYFFHFRQGGVYDTDEEGVDLPSIKDAKYHAVLMARDIVSDLVLNGEPIDGLRFEIADENGNVVIWPFKSLLD